ncbi:MAG: DUF3999 domain-containing protein [Planctomycetaceae bacterium]|nr:DUF3999 domain-containing protein [Planctomycetaceae bacterium]
MSKTTILATVLVAAASAFAQPAATAPADTSAWQRTAPVELQGPADRGLARIDLPGEVFDASRSNLADVRLLDSSGAFAPCLVRSGRLASHEESVLENARLLNATFDPGRGLSQVTADFGKKILKNEIFINTSGDNFRRRVQIEAGADGESWQVLRQGGWLFRIPGLFDKRRVDLPDNDFRYLRITVFNGQSENGKIDITDVSARHGKTIEPELAAVLIKQTTVNPTDENAPPDSAHDKDKKTIILLDCGLRNLPIARITMAFEDKNFARAYSIRGRNQQTQEVVEQVEGGGVRRKTIASEWNFVASGTIHRFTAAGDVDQSLELSPPPAESAYRYLRIEIANGDNAPLTFTGATVQRAKGFVLFQAKAGQKYQMLVGNLQASWPKYDLEHYADNLAKEGLTEARLGPLVDNPTYHKKERVAPWSERYKALLWGLLIGVGLLLLIAIMRKLKTLPPAEDDAQ